MKKMYKILFIFAFATSLFSSCSTENSSDDLSYHIVLFMKKIKSILLVICLILQKAVN